MYNIWFTVFKGYTPFTVIKKCWLYFPCCMRYPCSLLGTSLTVCASYSPTPVLPLPTSLSSLVTTDLLSTSAAHFVYPLTGWWWMFRLFLLLVIWTALPWTMVYKFCVDISVQFPWVHTLEGNFLGNTMFNFLRNFLAVFKEYFHHFHTVLDLDKIRI